MFLIKGATDKLAMTVSVAIGAALVSALVLPFQPMPAPKSWPFLGASVLLQSVYFLLIARAYRVVDMSLAYPLMRGAAPLVVALVGATVFGETLRVGQWMAIGLISAGIGALALGAFRQPLATAGAATALCNAMVIAAYTLVDASGARLSGAPVRLCLAAGHSDRCRYRRRGLRRAPPGRDSGVRTLGLGLVGGAATTAFLWGCLVGHDAGDRRPLLLRFARRRSSLRLRCRGWCSARASAGGGSPPPCW